MLSWLILSPTTLNNNLMSFTSFTKEKIFFLSVCLHIGIRNEWLELFKNYLENICLISERM